MEGVISPVVPSRLKPAVELYVPPVVPVWVTACRLDKEVQNGLPLYEILADGSEVITIDAVATEAEQPPEAPIV